ncbi:MAG: tRNA uridine-5-carboxymethylaminomethyl(34) synthesis GTPase MnmE [Pseudomonadales bacterium]|nr:tRNA uridine-5-carboxymethylaminomethyl(34) synthesis GTPase MnmE [Pseudomonadales bacterium]
MSQGEDTIAAIATAPGRGGIGIVRLSGRDALRIGECVAGRRLAPRHAHHAIFLDADGSPVDDGIAIAFHAPRSFTGEHVVELQGHGGPAVLHRLLSSCLALGARPARPGEFSERAFLNGRIDLAQAEAIADLVEAASTEAARAALRSLQGVFSERVRALMDAVTKLRVWVEAAIDFPDEDVDFIADGDVEGRIEGIVTELESVRREARQGALLAEGMTVVLAGAPNAGKSSLLNALARRDAAIVTEIPGTTRDVLRERIDLDGMPLHVVDTAGLRLTEDRVEAEGVRRALAEIERADALLYLVDVSGEEPMPSDRATLQALVGGVLPPFVLLLRNKIDLLTGERARLVDDAGLPSLALSVRTGEGLDLLSSALKRLVEFDGGEGSTFTARTRHLAALAEARTALEDAAATLVATGAGDLVADDLRRAHDALGRIVGEITPDDLLGEIFSSFCIGK